MSEKSNIFQDNLKGWNGKILRINLARRDYKEQEYDKDFARNYIGGRGFAAKILWDELKSGIDPLSSENKLIIAAGPLTGLAIPSSGKLVVAAKSPLTFGYGDGNIGGKAGRRLREVGYDAVVLESSSEKPVHIHVIDGEAEFLDAKDIWGLNSFEKEEAIRKKMGSETGVLLIGNAGENLVRFANIVSEKGRAGGRTGIGAVMGSKKVAAVTFARGDTPQVFDEERLKKLGEEAYRKIAESENYDFWLRQGTMMTVELCNENSLLPTRNFSEVTFEDADRVDGFSMEEVKVSRRGCSMCNMRCGNVIKDSEGRKSEIDYENVAMLGPNLGIGDIKKIGTLNRLCDMYGLDTISTGSVIGFAMESSERGVKGDIEFGDYERAKELIRQITFRRRIGDVLAEGVKRASKKFGGGSEEWAMHVKGLEVSAYNCYELPAMALAYGTSAIGAHHKDSWTIIWEVKRGKARYDDEVVDKVVEDQWIRGGMFESLTVCRFPWIVLGFDLKWYEKFFEAATGVKATLGNMRKFGNNLYSLIRTIFLREYGKKWSAEMDLPPKRWFKPPKTRMPSLNMEEYRKILHKYYKQRGWGKDGIPKQYSRK